MRQLLLLLLVGVVIGSGCGDENPTSPPERVGLERSATEMRALVDAAVAAVVSDRPSIVDQNAGQHGCGSETEDVAIDYGLSISVRSEDIPEVIEEVDEFWSERGSEDERPGDGLTFAFDGFIVGLTPFPDEHRITIGGSTDCFPPTSS